MRVALSSEGVFPLAQGEPTAVGASVSGTLQGEGILVGVPSLFVRLAGCNLRCEFRGVDGSVAYCDTPHAQRTSGGSVQEVAEVVQVVVEHLGALRHVVITGGEPMLQAEAVAELCQGLKMERDGLHITLETNGTIFGEEVAGAVDLVSVSPKRQKETFVDGKPSCDYVLSLQRWLDAKRGCRDALQLKFVVGRKEDEVQLIDPLLSALEGWERFPVVIMPMGGDSTTMRASEPVAVEMAIRRGWRYTPRLQVDLWGGRKGT